MSMPSGMELVLIVLVILLMFGGKKIPELAKGLGSGIRNFKKAIKDDEDEVVQNKSDEIEKKSETTTVEKNEDEEVADAKKVDEIEKKSEVNTTDKNETKQA